MGYDPWQVGMQENRGLSRSRLLLGGHRVDGTTGNGEGQWDVLESGRPSSTIIICLTCHLLHSSPHVPETPSERGADMQKEIIPSAQLPHSPST